MGFFKDIRQLNQAGKDMQRQAGIRPGLAGMKDAVSQANQMMQGLQLDDADAQRLMATGTVATGIVKSLRDTGTMVNMRPQVEFELEVTVPSQPAYTVTHRQVVAPTSIPQVQVGCPVSLRVDPMDVNRVLMVGI
jgi:hypothetical protein